MVAKLYFYVSYMNINLFVATDLSELHLIDLKESLAFVAHLQRCRMFCVQGSGFSVLMPPGFIWAAQDFDYTCRDVFGSDTLKLGVLKRSDKISTLLFCLSDMPR